MDILKQKKTQTRGKFACTNLMEYKYDLIFLIRKKISI